jgi:hypothetical protein
VDSPVSEVTGEGQWNLVRARSRYACDLTMLATLAGGYRLLQSISFCSETFY